MDGARPRTIINIYLVNALLNDGAVSNIISFRPCENTWHQEPTTNTYIIITFVIARSQASEIVQNIVKTMGKKIAY